MIADILLVFMLVVLVLNVSKVLPQLWANYFEVYFDIISHRGSINDTSNNINALEIEHICSENRESKFMEQLS